MSVRRRKSSRARVRTSIPRCENGCCVCSDWATCNPSASLRADSRRLQSLLQDRPRLREEARPPATQTDVAVSDGRTEVLTYQHGSQRCPKLRSLTPQRWQTANVGL